MFPKRQTSEDELDNMPSAQAAEGVEVELPSGQGRVRRYLRWATYSLGLFLFLIICGVGVLLWMVSRGPVSNEQMRYQIETQIGAFLGENFRAKIGDAKISYSTGGHLALTAENIRILRDQVQNLGVADTISVEVEALPLIRGTVRARSIRMDNAAISMVPFLPDSKSEQTSIWPETLNLAAALQGMGGLLQDLASGLDDAGLRTVELRDTRLVGFDQLGLRSKSARILEFNLSRSEDSTDLLNFDISLGLEAGLWLLNGTMQQDQEGAWEVRFDLDGLSLAEFLDPPPGEKDPLLVMDSALSLSVVSRYRPDGAPDLTSVAIKFGEGRLEIGDDHRAILKSARLNVEVLPDKNQFELTESPIEFEHASMTLIGGLRFPLKGAAAPHDRILMELIANDIKSNALNPDKPEALASFQMNGWINEKTRFFHADDLLLRTIDGRITGQGELGLVGTSPSLRLDLALDSMRVDTFKQLWPELLAAGARRWAKDGISGGVIKNATVVTDIPPGILGRIKHGARLENDHITAVLPIEGATVKTNGQLPPLENAKGVVRYVGMKTDIAVASATVTVPGEAPVEIGESTIALGEFRPTPFAVDIKLKLGGKAQSVGWLGTRKPIAFMKSIGLVPGDLSGRVSAIVNLAFKLGKEAKISDLDWDARVKIADGKSAKPISGRKFSKANLTIDVVPGQAKINGKATIDGVAADVALVEPFGTGAKSANRSISMTLNDDARKKLGIDTSQFITGPIDVVVATKANGSQHVSADLRNAVISLPFVGWSKGKGISATISFDATTKGKRTDLTNIKLRGDRFGATGSISLLDGDLDALSLKNVRMNREDNFAIKVSRKSGRYDVVLGGEAIDARALIQGLLEEGADKQKTRTSVTVTGKIKKVVGFSNQSLHNASINYVQTKGKVADMRVSAVADGDASTLYTMAPANGKMNIRLATQNAGSVLRFLNIYSKVRGGNLDLNLVAVGKQAYAGTAVAKNFILLDEPRLGQLLSAPRGESGISGNEQGRIINQIRKVDPNRVRIRQLETHLKKGPNYLLLDKGRIQGGDAAAAFKGTVYDGNNRMKIKGTFLPGYGLNQLISKLPIIGLAFGAGNRTGLLGITFQLSGPYKNPNLLVNPISIIAPGVFRRLFEF